MDTRHSSARFMTTNWHEIRRAADHPEALETLLRQYRGPIYAFIRARGLQPADAEDQTNQFIMDVVLKRKLLEKANPERGKFRSFIRTALRNWLNDMRKGRPAAELHENLPAAERVLDQFDCDWVRDLLKRAIEAVETDCRSNGMSQQWTAYEERELRPKIHGCESTPYELLMARFGVTDRQVIYSMVDTIKNKIGRELRTLVAQTVECPEEVDDELKLLRRLVDGK